MLPNMITVNIALEFKLNRCHWDERGVGRDEEDKGTNV